MGDNPISVEKPTLAMAAHTGQEVAPGLSPASAEADWEALESAKRRQFTFRAVPAWLISMLVHVGLIVVLAIITLEPAVAVITVLQGQFTSVDAQALDSYEIQVPGLEQPDSPADAFAVPSSQFRDVSVPEVTSPMMATAVSDLDALETSRLTEKHHPFGSSRHVGAGANVDGAEQPVGKQQAVDVTKIRGYGSQREGGSHGAQVAGSPSSSGWRVDVCPFSGLPKSMPGLRQPGNGTKWSHRHGVAAVPGGRANAPGG